MWAATVRGYRGETRLALTDRAAGFLVCGFQKKAPKRLLVGAKAGKSECWCPKPAPYDYHKSAIATVARRFHLPF